MDKDNELQQLIMDYSKSVSMGWHLQAPDIEDAMFTANERDSIHHLLKDNPPDQETVQRIKVIDTQWQEQLLEYISNGEVKVPYYPNHDEPQNKWWFHIEELDKLSEKDKSTL